MLWGMDTTIEKIAGLTDDEQTAWFRLCSNMFTSLDDIEAERYEKWCRTAAKKLRRVGLEEPPIDKAAVVRFLLKYAELKKSQGKCVAESKIDKVMLLTAYDLWPVCNFVRNYIADLLKQVHEIENDEILSEAREGLRRLNTDEECKLNAKTVMFTLAGLDKSSFAKKDEQSSSGKQQIVYNIPNLSLTMIMSPGELAAQEVTKRLEKESAIDVGGE